MRLENIRKVDIIGDIHGCYEELILLLGKLGYMKQDGLYAHQEKRKLVFVGDLCDRGPKSLEVITLVKCLVESGIAYHCPGNHDDKLMRWCLGRKVLVAHGLETTIAEILQTPDPAYTRKWIATYLKKLPLYLELDKGRLIVVHAGIRTDLIGSKGKKGEKKLREVCLYGFPTGRMDEHGLPERDPVAKHYRGKALLVHGHTPVHEPDCQGNVLNIDTGCVFGGSLTCYRYPENQFVQVKALQAYGKSMRFNPKESWKSV